MGEPALGVPSNISGRLPISPGMRALRARFPGGIYEIRPRRYLPKNLEIPSFDTTVRLFVGQESATAGGRRAHTCTESADRTAPARHTIPCSPSLSELPSSWATRFACTLPPRRGRSLRRKQGGAGGLSRLRRGIISPACLSCLFYLFCLSGAAPRCSGLVPFLSIAEIVFDSGGGGPYAWRMFF